MTAGVFETAGLRGADRMEDRHVIIADLARQRVPSALLAVFDGHRGPETAQYAAEHLRAVLRQFWELDK